MTDEEEKVPYPKGIVFIIGNEFCERFCYYGIRAILVLYLTEGLKFDEFNAKIIYHTFSMLVFFFPLIGAVIADSWLGSFKTIFFITLIYVSGSVLLPISAVGPLKLPQRETSLIALFLIAIGTGGIKPCIAAFGGDQFVLPQQEKDLATFFSLFYLAINAGSMITTFLTPIMRTEVHCFGRHNCYSLAFGVPAVMMVMALVVFLMGKPLYKIDKPKGNVLLDVTKCISHAISNRKIENPGNHWLDRSQGKYGAKLVKDIKIVGKVLIMFIPIPVFWALFEQQGSGWTFLAVRMNGDIGFYTILPDQMQIFNPILVLIFIPIFTYGVYPAFAKCHIIDTSLKKMCCGGFLAAASFAISAFVAMRVEATYPVLPGPGKAQLRIYDTTTCDYSVSTADNQIADARISGYYVHSDVKITKNTVQTVNFTFTSGSGDNTSCNPREMQMEMKEKSAYGIHISYDGVAHYEDRIGKSEDGYPLLRTLTSNSTDVVTYTHVKKGGIVNIPAGDTSLQTLPYVGTYLVDPIGARVDFNLGGIYTVLINEEETTMKTVVVTNPNTVHILWLVPQYVVMAIGEIMFSITSLEFSYSQSPSSMKALLQSFYLLTVAIGNFLIIGVEAIRVSDLPSYNFCLYCGLMVADMLVFMFLAIRYQYVNPQDVQ